MIHVIFTGGVTRGEPGPGLAVSVQLLDYACEFVPRTPPHTTSPVSEDEISIEDKRSAERLSNAMK